MTPYIFDPVKDRRCLKGGKHRSREWWASKAWQLLSVAEDLRAKNEQLQRQLDAR